MTKPVIRPGTLEDCFSLAPRLRPEDALELSLASGPDLCRTLEESFQVSSECFAAVLDGQVITLWGFGTTLHEKTLVGIPWMVGSPEMMRYPVSIVAAGRASVDRWQSQCEVMCNYTHRDNHIHHRWLTHLGFKFMPDVVPMGATGAPFLQFYRHPDEA